MLINEKTFTDFDLYANSMLKWDVEFNQLVGGQFRGYIKQIILPNVIVQKYYLNKSCSVRGNAPTGFYNFSLGIKSNDKTIWRGKQFRDNEIAVYPNGAEFDGVTPDDFNSFEIAISKKLLRKVSNYLGIDELDNYLKFNEICRCDPLKINRFKYLLNTLMNYKFVDPLVCPKRVFIKQAEYEVAESLLKTIHISEPKTGYLQTDNRMNAIGKVEELIADINDDRLTVLDLCEAANVSQRTLEYAFKNKFNMTPKQYLNKIRLNKVKRILQNPDDQNTKIIDAANLYGFWHMGQFAKDYKKLFGELPSDTLKS